MSSRANWPTPDPRPADVDDALTILGDRMCLEILRFLRPLSSANHTLLLKGTGLHRSTLSQKLVILEDKGCIVGDPPRGESRVGKTVNYSLVPERVETLTRAWSNYVFADTTDQ
jgi:DNA-binding transcriptional ArsR family regulator